MKRGELYQEHERIFLSNIGLGVVYARGQGIVVGALKKQCAAYVAAIREHYNVEKGQSDFVFTG